MTSKFAVVELLSISRLLKRARRGEGTCRNRVPCRPRPAGEYWSGAAATTRLSGFGYDVTVNEHFARAESIHKHGNPEAGEHSLQIEINRSLYMDEDRYHRGDKFETVRAHLEQLICGLAEFARRKAQ